MMKTRNAITSVMSAMTLTGLMATSAISAEEKDATVPPGDVPSAVMKTLKKAAGDAAIDKVTKGDEDGKVVYEAVVKVNGKDREITVSPAGKLTGVEEAVELSTVPEAARAAIEKQAAGGKLGAVEKMEASGKTTYEAVIESKGKKMEYEFSPAGKLIATEAVAKD